MNTRTGSAVHQAWKNREAYRVTTGACDVVELTKCQALSLCDPVTLRIARRVFLRVVK